MTDSTLLTAFSGANPSALTGDLPEAQQVSLLDEKKTTDDDIERVEFFPLAVLFAEEEELLISQTSKWQQQNKTCDPLIVFPTDRSDLKVKLDIEALNGNRRRPPACFECTGKTFADGIQSFQRWFSPCPTAKVPSLLQYQHRKQILIHLQDPQTFNNLKDLAETQSRVGHAARIFSGPVLERSYKDYFQSTKGGRLPLFLLQADLLEYDTENLPVPGRAAFFIKDVTKGEIRDKECDSTIASNWDGPGEAGVFLKPKHRAANVTLCSLPVPMCQCVSPIDLAWSNRLMVVPFGHVEQKIDESNEVKHPLLRDIVEVDVGDIVTEGKTDLFLVWMVAQYFPYLGERTIKHVISIASKGTLTAEQLAELKAFNTYRYDKDSNRHYARIQKQALLDLLIALEKKSGRSRLLDGRSGFGINFRIPGGAERADSILREMRQMTTEGVRDAVDDKTKEVVQLQFYVKLEVMSFHEPDRLPSFLWTKQAAFEGKPTKKQEMPKLGRIEDLLKRKNTSARLVTAEEYAALHARD